VVGDCTRDKKEEGTGGWGVEVILTRAFRQDIEKHLVTWTPCSNIDILRHFILEM